MVQAKLKTKPCFCPRPNSNIFEIGKDLLKLPFPPSHSKTKQKTCTKYKVIGHNQAPHSPSPRCSSQLQLLGSPLSTIPPPGRMVRSGNCAVDLIIVTPFVLLCSSQFPYCLCLASTRLIKHQYSGDFVLQDTCNKHEHSHFQQLLPLFQVINE